MKKTLVVVLIIVSGFSGFLYYDWHTKTKKQTAEPSIPQYSWTDKAGVRHFTDTAPPQGSTDIKETKGYKYIELPLIYSIRNKVVDYYKKIREKLFNPQKKKKKKRKE